MRSQACRNNHQRNLPRGKSVQSQAHKNKSYGLGVDCGSLAALDGGEVRVVALHLLARGRHVVHALDNLGLRLKHCTVGERAGV